MDARSFLRFWACAFALLAAAWIGLFALQLGVVTPLGARFGKLADTKREIALRQNASPGPKTVLLGGSNVLYGLQAETLERATGRPATNYGLILGFGPEGMIRQAERPGILRPGDTLVLALEYEQYQDALFRDDTLMEYALSLDPGFFRALPLSEKARWVFGIHERRLKQALRIRFGGHVEDKPLGVDENLTPWGDEASNLPENQDWRAKRSVYGRRIPDHSRILPSATRIWPALLGLRDWCDAHGVRLRIAFPAYFLPESPVEAARLDRFFGALLVFYDANGFVRLGTPWETLRPRTAFYDSEYHPFHREAQERTEALAAELLASEPKKP